jgi:predicted enzyme related to lactoylglutathione lyase
MLENAPAFFSWSVDDLARAKRFYGETLGLDVADGEMEAILEIRLAGGGTAMVYAKPDHQPATFTVLNFPVPNIDEAVAELGRRGVRFEQYGGEIATDEKGVHRADGRGPSLAWFKDPAGNILSVVEQPS